MGTPETLAEQLRAAVLESGLTVNAIAKASGVPQPVLYRFVAGERDNLRLDVADRLCQLFGMRLTKPRKVRV